MRVSARPRMMQARSVFSKLRRRLPAARSFPPCARVGFARKLAAKLERRVAMHDVAFLPITELSRRIAAQELDPVDLRKVYLERVAGIGRSLNCYLALCQASAAQAAEEAAQRARAKARLGPLDGIPIGIKDNIDVAGVPTGNGFGGTYPAAATDAVVVHRLRAQGAVILGKLNMQEGALGAVNDNPHHGRTHNPFRQGYTPGGSSGGSGAAVAAGLCAAALGTDTGGSVRIPAAYCGQVGLKPSYGRVSTRGVVPLSLRLDHVGPLTRTVSDAALLLAAMAGEDPDWPYARAFQAPDPSPPSPILKGLRLGILSNLEQTAIEPSVQAAWQRALELLQSAGASVATFTLPTYDVVRGRRAVFVRVEVEAAMQHEALYRREPERFSAEMKGYFDWGLSASAVRLAQADRTIERAAHELSRALASVDAILTPTTPQAAFAFDGPVPDSAGDFCVLANMAGCPAISVPMGVNEGGLPLGLQFLAAAGEDQRLLAIALAYERAAGFSLAPPAKFAGHQRPRVG
jgi:aspartyl-tRNA(Asn)/glutamyl-tRNA(Gln) amidotransferase subunit A